MSETPPAAVRLVSFGIFELDLRSGELRRAGVRLNFQDQSLQVLTLLLERPGELVTRDELRRRLWPDNTFVDVDHGLNAIINRLRDTLGDSADRPRFIETLPRRGYRFIAPIARDGHRTEAPSLPAHGGMARPGTDEPARLDSEAGGRTVGRPASTEVLPHPARHTSVSSETIGGHVARRRRMAVAASLVAITLLALGGWWTLRSATARKAAPSAPVERTLTRLTFDPGLQTDVTWSPDGRFIAYASDRAGTFNIWVQPVMGGDAVQVTKSPGQDTEPDWSPDGSTIVFRSEREGGGLFVVPSLGGTERRLTSFGVQPKWSPDGSRVLFASSPDSNSRATYLVSLDNAPPQPILEDFVDADLRYVTGRVWHPDGRVSILGATRSQGFGLFTFPISGGRPRLTRILPAGRGRDPDSGRDVPQVMQVQWAPSGAAVYFEGRINFVSNVWRVAVDPESLETRASERLTTGGGQDTRVALSQDGKHAAFTTQAESIRLWSFPFDAAVGRILGDGQPVTAMTTAALAPALAPDGRRIAYPLRGAGTRSLSWELWTQDVVGGERRQLARDNIRRLDPKWAPDGTRLTYRWERETATTYETTIAVRSVAGGDEWLLADPGPGGGVLPYGWSRDGKSVLVSAYLSASGRFGVTLWPLAAAPHADKAARVLASNPDCDLHQESFSPNGRWIVIQAIDRRVADATSPLYVIPSAGAESTHSWTRLTDSDAWADKPRWSPDGKRLYFWLRQGSAYNVWGVRFDDEQGTTIGAPFQVTRFDGRARHIYSTDLEITEQSVSRTRLLLPMADTTGSIWMLDNVDR